MDNGFSKRIIWKKFHVCKSFMYLKNYDKLPYFVHSILGNTYL